MGTRPSSALTVVSGSQGAAPSVAEQIKRLQTQARGLAREHIVALETALAEVEQLAADIATGGESYPVGVREVARRLADECETSGANLKLLAARG